jgi:intermediate cleaving peptidase 55
MVLDKSGKFTLFLKPEDIHSRVWDGPRTGLEGAKSYFGADEARPISEFPAYLKSLNGEKIYTDLDIETGLVSQFHLKFASNSHAASSPDEDPSITSFILNSLRKPNSDLPAKVDKKALIPLMHPMRCIKSESEIACMKKACDITSESFKDMIQYVKPGMSEHEIQAFMEFKCKVRGGDTMAYVPVVAGGANANVIHYVTNNQIVNDGDLILVDAGAEYGGYCADITRTFPVNGKYSPAQREIYSAVLEANKLAITRCRAGLMSLDAIHNESVDLLYRSVHRIFNRRVSPQEMQSLYPHHIAHYLGLGIPLLQTYT